MRVVMDLRTPRYTPDENEILRRLEIEATAIFDRPVPAEDVLWLAERNRQMWITLHENGLIDG